MIEIYFLFTENFKTSNLEAYESYLSCEERERMSKFIFQKDKDQFILTRTLVRTILSKKLGVHFSDLKFGKNDYGKPYLSDFSSEITFNISHAPGLIVLAIIKNSETIGIDVENRDREINLDMGSFVFTDQEIQDYANLPANMQRKRFFELWTLKESYMKALGKGFSLSPKSFSFIFENDQCHFFENPVGSLPEKVGFQLFEVTSLYSMAVCYQGEIKGINSFCILSNWEIGNFEINPILVI
jgi:4'-phosphopantetheinyl transferase